MLTPEQKNIECAKLDGLEFHYSDDGYCVRKGEPTYHLPPNYSTSYDAIIPLIQKQSQDMMNKFLDASYDLFYAEQEARWESAANVLTLTPSQLQDALLRAHGHEIL